METRGESEERRDEILWKAEENYIDALVQLKEAFPDDVCCTWFEIGACEHGQRCACGRMRAPWPWVRIFPEAPRRYCRCFTAAERLAWVSTYALEHSAAGLWGCQRLDWSPLPAQALPERYRAREK